MANAKDAFYFPHDANAKDDPKCVMLIEQLGLEGYGIYWILVEILRDQPGYRYPLMALPAIARKYNTTTSKVETVVRNYGLFGLSEDAFFFSESLNRRMEGWERKKEQTRLAGKRSGEARALKAQAEQLQLPELCEANDNRGANVLSFAFPDVASTIYSDYPRNEGKAKGMEHLYSYLHSGRHFNGIGRVKFNHHQIRIAVQMYAKECQKQNREKTMIKLFSTFMNKEVLDWVEKTQAIYEKLMEKHYGVEWREKKFEYR